MKKFKSLKINISAAIISLICFFTVFCPKIKSLTQKFQPKDIKITLNSLKNSIKPEEAFCISICFENNSGKKDYFGISNFEMSLNFDHSKFELKESPGLKKNFQKNAVDISRNEKGFNIDYRSKRVGFLVLPEGRSEFLELKFSVKDNSLPENCEFFAEILHLNKKDFYCKSEILQIEILEDKKQKEKREKEEKQIQKEKEKAEKKQLQETKAQEKLKKTKEKKVKSAKKTKKKPKINKNKVKTYSENEEENEETEEKQEKTKETSVKNENKGFKIYLVFLLGTLILGSLGHLGFISYKKKKVTPKI